ncbi:hypothetical protein BU16DRAFT_532398 [Lophium mytilinum]|uniref:GPI anchored protein n=1 Tax=Lophium mytilinum TaxID=390894 RepID=A0A6A6RC73_9PEZI|nr:hypothetical protein BU16DRAFT_532398 [Lophium mytilinum]
MKASTTLLVPTALVLAGLPLAPAASTPTVTLLLPYNGASTTYLGSVITAAPSSTEYAVTCAPLPASASATDDGDFCGPEFTITQGPSIWAFAYTVEGGGETLSAKCTGDIDHSSELTCTQSVGGSGVTGTEKGIETTTMQPSDYLSVFGAVTVTAGGEKLSGVASATASDAKGTATGSATGAAASTGAASANGLRQGAVAGVAGVVLAALAL